MKNKIFIFVTVIIAIALIAAIFVLVKKPHILTSIKNKIKAAAKAPAKAAAATPAAKAAATAPVAKAGQKPAVAAPQKPISKDRGALTVKAVTWNNQPAAYKMRAFRVTDKRSSEYIEPITANKTSELLPGAYDLVIDTLPQKIYKGVKVDLGKETVEDIGCMAGAMKVNILNAKGKPATYPMRVMHAKTNIMVTALTASKAPVELLPGIYDLEVGTTPKEFRRNVKIESGKETAIDLGCITGSLTISVIDANNKPVRTTARVKKVDTNETVYAGAANTSIELLAGTYTVEVLTKPSQTYKDVVVKIGEDTKVTQAPPAPAPAAQ